MKTNELLEQINMNQLPNHIGIILDGNGRWAAKRGLPRIMGHQRGIKTLEKVVKASKELGIKNLTVFAFSTENINRPADEVKYLMNLFMNFYRNQYPKVIKNKMNILIIGELDNLNNDVKDAIKDINSHPFCEDYFTLTIAFNYGSHQEIIHMVKEIASDVKKGILSIDKINELEIEKHLYTKNLYPLDFVIRTSGEYRISNFLLWQLSYAELEFPVTYFPDYNEKELYKSIIEYQKRDRRFGKLGEKKA